MHSRSGARSLMLMICGVKVRWVLDVTCSVLGRLTRRREAWLRAMSGSRKDCRLYDVKA